MSNQRSLTPYEKNQLLKYGVSRDKLMETEAPVEYLTGQVDFCDLNFLVNNNVLIPRVETEELVELAVKNAQLIHKLNPQKVLRIVDVGTGSGAIAISVSKKLKDVGVKHRMIASDLSAKALELAQKNRRVIDAILPIEFKKANLLASAKETDLIIANLPYIPSERISKLDNSVKNFEPLLALDGGKDGLDLIRKLLIQAKKLIAKNGLVLLELDITHNQEKMKEFEKDWKIKIVKSNYGGVYFGSMISKQ